MALVMYGHFVSVGSGAKHIPLIINESAVLPLLSPNILTEFDAILIRIFSTQSGILGVSIFFLVTGYLMPLMMTRYSRVEFLINRYFRIFPSLYVAILCIGVFLFISQGITFSYPQYFHSFFLTYFLYTAPVTGVLWTLVIEVAFYLLCFGIGKFTLRKIIIIQLCLVIFIYVGCSLYPIQFKTYIVNLRYITMILVGSSIYIAESYTRIGKKIFIVFVHAALCYLTFYMTHYYLDDNSTYTNLQTHLIVIIIFFACRICITEKMYLSGVIQSTANLVYPLYLLHASVGLSLIERLREYLTTNIYVLIFLATVIVILCSYILHIFIERISIRVGRTCIAKLPVLCKRY